MDQPPNLFDETYFCVRPWKDRLELWAAKNPGAFLSANQASIRRRLADESTSARVVVNIGEAALMSFLQEGRYRNAYEISRVGGNAPVDHYRAQVDQHLGLGEETYFAAVSMGGSGVRYFGEYCMVLAARVVGAKTQLLDRDSYDTLYSPLDQMSIQQIRDMLFGTWTDVDDMILSACFHEFRMTFKW